MAYISIIADILMIAASAGAAIYCIILSRRLARLTSFDKGIGGAIAVLSAQVDEMKAALAEARLGRDGVSHQLHDQLRQAREISAELELMIAACHDFAEEAMAVQAAAPAPASAAAAMFAPDDVATQSVASAAMAAAPRKTANAPALPETDMAPAALTFDSRRAGAARSARLGNRQG